jgi:hypothetical protein
MRPRIFRVMLPGVIVLTALAAYAGGWVTVTVEELPDHVVAKQPVDFTFTVRQHGFEPLDDLKPTVEATAGRLRTSVAATKAKETGQYTAALSLPEPADWTITIHSGFRDSKVTLMPLTATANGKTAPSPLSDAERGRRLFVAKGCMTCHMHREVNSSGAVPLGPELTDRRWASGYLAQFLANPESRATPGATAKMPNLGLDGREIAALNAFLNGN